MAGRCTKRILKNFLSAFFTVAFAAGLLSVAGTNAFSQTANDKEDKTTVCENALVSNGILVIKSRLAKPVDEGQRSSVQEMLVSMRSRLPGLML